jgi:Transposase DNA-binding
MKQWITQELLRTELGDTRRTKRLIKIVENLSAKPEATIPRLS